ncbi:YggS family pyridoxal phosphate-dependent enzyme [Paenibacillus ehimensis]|uniref:YggS family pyridoxal phosphate-dependent enzyme n=1 Tax=Paenibacillus ehimensis TaxID=79264 RepID=UPI002DC020C5|nr:YggS family pyridoxal phosphate-dependent enzyme [Paenibacillus ehimensis]MEC0210863.1 YggS family pyridoxal phosphate-dependent enzyme [Paenibacillus ehimensis]
MLDVIASNLAAVERRIQAACLRAGRRREDVGIIAVTKYGSADLTAKMLQLGMAHIGENRWQHAQPKWEALGGQGSWHFIGHLQTNKVKDVVGKFAYIHSLDRMSLATEIQRKADALGEPVRCFIQVNVSGEESKYGLPPEELIPFARQVSKLDAVQVVGLMTMAPLDRDAEAARPVFRGLRQLRDELNEAGAFGCEVQHLSMGMSGDFEVAIEEGATWLRLGSVLCKQEGGA